MNRKELSTIALIAITSSCFLILFPQFSSALTWIETTQEDFADGFYEANLYASIKLGGAIEFAPRWDLNKDGYLDLVVSNGFGTHSNIYWGSSNGYSSGDRTEYPVTNGGCVEVADITNDGNPELIISARTHFRIFEGTASGPDTSSYSDVPTIAETEALFIADYNKDGYLDLATGSYNSDSAGVFWGSSSGYSNANMCLVPGDGDFNIESADFDKDGWLDMLVEQESFASSLVYWGSPTGFSPANVIQLPNPPSGPAHGCSVADFDKDGFLDIVITGYYSCNTMYIYRGSSIGFLLWQTLTPGECYGGTSVADFNDDAYLDILCMRGYGVFSQPRIYWGSSSGFSDANITDIGIPVDASGSLVADFDYDGNLDVFVNGYYPDSFSYVFYGDSFTNITSLPSNRDHHGQFREIGNVYTREYREEYISSVFDGDSTQCWQSISWDDSLPRGSDIAFAVRTGETPQPDSLWSSWVRVYNDSTIPDSLASQYIQYLAVFSYVSAAYLPCLWEVRIEYQPQSQVYEEEKPPPSHMGLQFLKNPVKGNYVKLLLISPNNTADIILYNHVGQRLKTYHFNGLKSGENRLCLDIDGLPSGIYFLKLDGKPAGKVVKVR